MPGTSELLVFVTSAGEVTGAEVGAEELAGAGNDWVTYITVVDVE